MSHAINLEPTVGRRDSAAIDTIARQTSTSIDLVTTLYEDEVATLTAQAKIRQFVGVIASRRVKLHLRELSAQAR